MLLKPIAEIPHEGRQAIKPGSREYQIVRQWIAEGAKYEDPQANRANKIEVFPLRLKSIFRGGLTNPRASLNIQTARRGT